MSKNTKPPVQSARARARSVQKLSAMIERELQRRLGPKSTFEQRNNMRAEIIKEAAFQGEGDDLHRMVTDDEEVDEEDGRYRRLDPPSSATYFGRWGPHEIGERLYRKVGVHNGPTLKPIERRAGIIEHMTPDMACIVGGLGADLSSREVERTLWRTGIVSPSRAFLEKRGSKLAQDVATKAVELEVAARATEEIPEEVASVSGGLDRMSVRANEPCTDESRRRPRRTEPYVRPAQPPPQEAHWRKAWAGSMSFYDGEGKELCTRMYGAEANTDPNALADRVAADIAAVVRARPDVKVHCVQDAAPELRALPEALTRALPPGKSFVHLVDIEHLARDYLDVVVDKCQPEGDPHDMKGWYRSELLRHDDAIDRIWVQLREKANDLPEGQSAARDAVESAMSYIRDRKDKMRYASHYAANLPIGSGATEGTCWQMQARVKRAGQSWGTDVKPDQVSRTPGLNGVMTTRGLVLSDRWDSAWPTYAATHRKELRCAA